MHIEKSDGGGLFFYQKTSGADKYAPIKDIKFGKFEYVLDQDFSAAVYPKDIKIVSNSLPEVAVVTFA